MHSRFRETVSQKRMYMANTKIARGGFGLDKKVTGQQGTFFIFDFKIEKVGYVWAVAMCMYV